MSMVCDACGTKFGRNDGLSTLNVSPPLPDYRVFQEFAAIGQLPTHHDPLRLDLCLTCTARVLEHLGLSTAICAPPQMPPTPADPAQPPTGALTEDDLRQLGLTEDDLQHRGLTEPASPT